jgi:pyridoxine kinase
LSRYELPEADLSGMLAALQADGCWPMLDAVFTGYFPAPAAVCVAADAIVRMKAAKPSLLVCIDPILGDAGRLYAGRLYVGQETAEAIRDRLVPLADVATPNLFELGWLTGTPAETATDIVRSACSFGPAMVVVTSAAHTAAGVGTLLVVRGSISEHQTRTRSAIPNGAGDVLAGLFLGRLLRGEPAEAALRASLASLDQVLAASEGQPVLNLGALHRDPT